MKKIIGTILGIALLLTTIPQAHAATPIMGRSELNAYQMDLFVKKINPSAPRLARMFLEEGAREGVRGDLAFAQSLKETGYFRYGGDVLPEQNNFAGIGATNDTQRGRGAWFETPREGIRAQIQHLKAYASAEPLSQEKVDPRFHLVRRRSAPNIEDLNGKWAVPGPTYGQDIMRIFNDMKSAGYSNRLTSLRAKMQLRYGDNLILSFRERLRERLRILRQGIR
jgi:hypothetical protein